MGLLSKFRIPCSGSEAGYRSVLGVLCCLLVAVAVFVGVQSIPVCANKLVWAVTSLEAVLLELLGFILLVIACTSILVVVGGTLGPLTECVVAFILVLYNTALVDLVRRLCFLPGRCLWLTFLVLPLFLLTLLLMCRKNAAVPRKPT